MSDSPAIPAAPVVVRVAIVSAVLLATHKLYDLWHAFSMSAEQNANPSNRMTAAVIMFFVYLLAVIGMVKRFPVARRYSIALGFLTFFGSLAAPVVIPVAIALIVTLLHDKSVDWFTPRSVDPVSGERLAQPGKNAFNVAVAVVLIAAGIGVAVSLALISPWLLILYSYSEGWVP